MKDVYLLQGGDNIENEASFIAEKVEADPRSCFVLDDPECSLSQYIEYLYDPCGLDNRVIFSLRICRQISFDGNVSYIPEQAGGEDGKNIAKPGSMKDLLELLEPGIQAKIVFENNDRALFADVLQQLIYLDYPITELNLMLRSEFEQIDRVRRFMNSLDSLVEYCDQARENLQGQLASLPEAPEEEGAEVPANAGTAPAQDDKFGPRADRRNVQKALSAFDAIAEKLAQAEDLEMKVAVAASKKTGKSVIVNCMLGQELAPTSLEMATPNTCIYRKSDDDKFHLEYGGDQNRCRESFDSREEIFRFIDKQFKEAQKDSSRRFSIEDMIIDYVSRLENFSSYTVYDTPGPDAAGTDHARHAMDSMAECDASIFAIDYSKYLITSEEEYLATVKDIFTEKDKLHTLIFDINKIDMMFQDKGSKSRVKSIDFIRNRLMEIGRRRQENDTQEDGTKKYTDNPFRDCVVFATSAQDYFYTCELEEYKDKVPAVARLFEPGANWYRDLRGVMDELEDDKGNQQLIDLLSNLETICTRLRRQLNYQQVGLKEIRQYSGIPQLLNYASYVMQKKAREEIINNLAFEISQNFMALSDIKTQIDAIIRYATQTEEEIAKITSILKKYRSDIEMVLKLALTESDISGLNNDMARYGLTEQQLGDFNRFVARAVETGRFPVEIEKLLNIGADDIKKDMPNEEKSHEDIFNAWGTKQLGILRSLDGKIEEIESIQRRLGEIRSTVEEYFRKVMEEPFAHTYQLAENLAKVFIAILNVRFARVHQITKEYQADLEKEDIGLSLPEISPWQVDFPVPSLETLTPANLYKIKIEVEKFEQLNIVHQFVRNIWDTLTGNASLDRIETKIDFAAKAAEYRKLIAGRRDSVDAALYRAKVYKELKGFFVKLAEEFKSYGYKLFSEFSRVTGHCEERINEFVALIDDRDRFTRHLAACEQSRLVCAEIDRNCASFTALWHEITVGATPDGTTAPGAKS